jgi:predicted site-specific integrase-resolvase
MCYIYHSMVKPCNTQQAAKAAGIAVMTLHRWVVAKRLKAPNLRIRNGRAVRLWSKADLDRLLDLKQAIYCKGRGRKTGYKRK